jgi:hypothetical protein
MIGACYCSKIEQNISSAKGVYKLLPLLDQGNLQLQGGTINTLKVEAADFYNTLINIYQIFL